MTNFMRCDECGATIGEGYGRKSHISIDRYATEEDETSYGMASLDYCDVVCLRAYLDAGKPL